MSVLKVEVEAKIPATTKVEQPIPVLINNIPIGGEKGQVLTKKSGKPYDVAWENPKGGEGGGEVIVEGVTEERVEEIVSEKTKDLQPKVDESLETESKQVVGAINEVNGGLVKGIDSSIAEETNELVLELKGKDGTVLFSTKVQLPKSALPDLSGYVTFTDYPTGTSSGKAGVVKTDGQFGISSVFADYGLLSTMKATNAELEAKTNQYKPIVPSNQDKAWQMSAINNKEEWTDDDEAAACETIGALLKPTNDNGIQCAICLDKNGNVVLQIAAPGQRADGIAMSDAYGRLNVASAFVSKNLQGFHALQANDLFIIPDHVALTDEQKAKWRAWLGIE